MTARKRQRQLITSDRAAVVERQPVKPCGDCPWARAALPGWLGPWNSHQWLALAHGGGHSECHATKGPGNRSWACAGFAIYQANVCKLPEHPAALSWPVPTSPSVPVNLRAAAVELIRQHRVLIESVDHDQLCTAFETGAQDPDCAACTDGDLGPILWPDEFERKQRMPKT